jgi:glucose/arabinose dehydrogenase
MQLARLAGVLAWALIVCGCGGSPTPSPGEGGGTAPIPVQPSSRLGWDQQAADIAELNDLRFVIYIDNTRTELAGASCSTTAGGAGYPCTAPLPPMSAGQHTLELASYLVAGSVIESARSAPLTIRLSGSTGITAVTTPHAAPDAALSVRSPRTPSRELTTPDGARLQVDVVTAAEMPSAMAVADDGTVLLGYADRIRVVHNREVIGDEALQGHESAGGSASSAILDLALDREFTRNHLVYVLQILPGESPTFRLSRFREAGGRLGERAVLLDRVPAARPDAAGSVTVGADDRLYIGFDDADNPTEAQRAGSYNGKVLRLNADGTTPGDEPAANPVYASGFRAPGSLSWDALSASLWVADRKNGELRRLRRVSGGRRTEVAYTLPESEKPASIAMYHSDRIPDWRGDLLVVPAGQQDYLIRARPTRDETTLTGTGHLTIPGGAPVRLVESAADGAIYVATEREVLRLTPR